MGKREKLKVSCHVPLISSCVDAASTTGKRHYREFGKSVHHPLKCKIAMQRERISATTISGKVQLLSPEMEE